MTVQLHTPCANWNIISKLIVLIAHQKGQHVQKGHSSNSSLQRLFCWKSYQTSYWQLICTGVAGSVHGLHHGGPRHPDWQPRFLWSVWFGPNILDQPAPVCPNRILGTISSIDPVSTIASVMSPFFFSVHCRPDFADPESRSLSHW